MPTYFVLCRQVLIGIVKIDRMCRCVPFNDGAWSRVRDHFGDQFVRCTFVGPVECSQLGLSLMDAKAFSLVAGVALFHLVRIFGVRVVRRLDVVWLSSPSQQPIS